MDATIERFGRHRAEPHDIHGNSDLYNHYFAEELALFGDDFMDGPRDAEGQLCRAASAMDTNDGLRRAGTLEIARRLGWTAEDGHYALSPRSESAHKAIGLDLEKVFGLFQAISASKQAGEPPLGMAGELPTATPQNSGWGKQNDENGQVDKPAAADRPESAMNITGGMKRKLEADGHASGRDSEQTDDNPEKRTSAMAGLATPVQMAAALLSNGMGHMRSLSFDSWKAGAACESGQQADAEGRADCSGTACGSVKREQQEAAVTPRAFLAKQDEGHLLGGQHVQMRSVDQAGVLNRSVVLPTAHSQGAQGTPASNIATNASTSRSAIRQPNPPAAACKPEQPVVVQASQLPRHALPVLGYSTGTDALARSPHMQDKRAQPRNGVKPGQILTLMQTEHGLVAVPLQLNAAVGPAGQRPGADRPPCTSVDPALLARLQNLANGTVCQPKAETPRGPAKGGNSVPLLTGPPRHIVVKPDTAPQPQIVVASQGFPLVLTGQEASSSQAQPPANAAIAGLSSTDLLRLGLVRQLQIPQAGPQGAGVTWAAAPVAAGADGTLTGQAFSVGVAGPSGRQLPRTVLLQMPAGRPRQGEAGQ
eukprot:evm.model.scf_651.4 EVM.evm.TU.scf_651.4   scf_651:36030-42768(+)